MDDQTQNNNQNSGTNNAGGNNNAGANNMNAGKEQVKQAMHGIEAWLAPIFANFPHIPENGRKVIVDIAPWIVLIFGILGVLSLLGVGGMGMGGLAYLTSGYGMPLYVMVNLLVGLVCAVLLLMSYPGIKARTKKGWNLVFYSQVVSVAGSVIMLVLGGMNYVIGAVIGAIIGFWILFEVRDSYK